jgi:hypothetical protein
MGADAVPVYVGTKITIAGDDELEAVEEGSDERVKRAKKAKLKTYLGRTTDGGEQYLLVGIEVGVVGVENASHLRLTSDAIAKAFDDAKTRLADGGFSDEPALHVVLNAQY